ncbi:DUF1428 domain-containing protein [Luteolibacter yonseiensis]|uniref:DUF1428 domain-containing protein n=1 Tax=Luteolibacter yonseiensis TaxID=1144680 RepID=A0A934R868_9BACT|nr:DUF1428 domain-containing protein [Luteolibacter yonseiensis]MBK1816874.1 DUF1428 domain-containing protein [Luteolibacter yonseiensis]
MKNYVDGFVIPVPKANIEKYRVIAEKAGALWREHGAIDYFECVGDDLEVENMVSFPRLANAGPEDTVVFAWITYSSREHRDDVNAKVMADPRMQEMMDPNDSTFDCSKMSYGGFKVIVNA